MAHGSGPPAVDPSRTIADLRELEARTANADGAQRVAWTPTWRRARRLLEERAAAAGLTAERDRAGNLWFVLPGAAEETVVIGSHLDSVPDGGWLDGALGVFAGLEVLRALAARDAPPARTVALVDFADEEGSRFGRSLVGSSALAGTLDPGQLAGLTDADGITAAEALRENGVDLPALVGRDARLDRVVAYLELHIEQGPVLESRGASLAAVSGTIGIERDRLIVSGTAAHAGPTPMHGRHDALLVAAETAVAAETIALRHGGRATTGRIDLSPGIPTAVAGHAVLYTDLRHEEASTLAAMREETLAHARERAAARGCGVERERVWSIEPRAFDTGLVARARAACRATTGDDAVLVSGALHDAAELAPIVPTAMLFCASRGGLSHCAEEDTSEPDLERAVRALAALAGDALDMPFAQMSTRKAPGSYMRA